MINFLFKTLNAAARTVVAGNGFQVIPNFGLNWSFALKFRTVAAHEVPASPECQCHILQEVDIRIAVNIGMLEIRIALKNGS